MTDNRLAAIPQPAPTGEGEIVLTSAVRHIAEMLEAGFGADRQRSLVWVRDDLCARARMGKEKYGTFLRTHNGRDPIVDQYQEVLDALMYSRQSRDEGDTEGSLFFETYLHIAERIATLIQHRKR